MNLSYKGIVDSPHSKKSLTNILATIGSSFIAVLIACIYLYDLGSNPYGFFGDEAIIGVQGFRVAQTHFSDVFVHSNPLFYHHFKYIFGSLPILSTAPFILLFGLSEFSVRLASVFFLFTTLCVLYACLRTYIKNWSILPILLLAFSPWSINLGRVNFGLSVSLFLIALGYYLFLHAKKPYTFSLLAGLFFAMSMYGYAGFYIGTLVFVFSIVIGELFTHRFRWKRYKSLVVMLLTFVICLAPLFQFALTSDSFFSRLKDKNQNTSLFTSERVLEMIKNYPKYYSYSYLFEKGEIEQPGAFITRHSVKGAGMLLPVSMVFLILGIISLAAISKDKKTLSVQSLVLFLLYPLPDLITTRSSIPPYSISLFTTIFFLPFLVTSGIQFLLNLPFGNLFKSFISIVLVVLSIFTIVMGISFYTKLYDLYPQNSSDFWGWQAGPRDIMQFFKENESHYDEFYLEGAFNEPEVFLDFYLTSPSMRAKAFTGNTEKYKEGKKQLFALTRESWEKLEDKDVFILKKTIYYPGGKEAFRIIEHL